MFFTPALRERGLARLYELECRLLPAVLAMEDAGLGLDLAGFNAIAAGWQREKDAAPPPERLAQLDKLLSTYAHWARDFVADDGRMRPHLHPLATDSGRLPSTATISASKRSDKASTSTASNKVRKPETGSMVVIIGRTFSISVSRSLKSFGP